MTFECELSQLYVKWKEIEALGNYHKLSDDEKDKLLLQFRSNENKISSIFKYLSEISIENIIQNNPKLLQTMIENFTDLNPRKFVKYYCDNLFKPRNRILHLGIHNYNESDAIKCIKLSRFGLDILKLIDKRRQILTV